MCIVLCIRGMRMDFVCAVMCSLAYAHVARTRASYIKASRAHLASFLLSYCSMQYNYFDPHGVLVVCAVLVILVNLIILVEVYKSPKVLLNTSVNSFSLAIRLRIESRSVA